MPDISLRNIVKEYRRGPEIVPVLSHLDLEIASGEFLALVGPSGSGKSTLLNLIGGLDQPTSGEVVIGDEHLESMRSVDLGRWRARNVGFVFQFYNLMPTISAERNVELPLFLTSLSSRDRQAHVDAALQLVGLQDRRRHKPGELSGGQQQRVAIARALVADAPLLICDEPTGDLDREAADQVLELLQMLGTSRGKTVVMVTHDHRAAEYASRIVRLDKGVLATQTPVAA